MKSKIGDFEFDLMDYSLRDRSEVRGYRSARAEREEKIATMSGMAHPK
jgi:hypothetical protein